MSYLLHNCMPSATESGRTVVCVKRVRKGMPEEEWDESMPLPGDVIHWVAATAEGKAAEAPPRPPRVRSEISSQLGRLNRRSGLVRVRVRRGDAELNLMARVAHDPERDSKLHRRYTIQAATDDRHIAVLDDLDLDQVTKLQEMSRTVVNMDTSMFRTQGIKYDWKKQVGIHLPDRRSTMISSILFMPFPDERTIGSITTRSMAWFSAVVSSGAPLIFVNIQTEQLITTDKATSSQLTNDQTSWRDMNRCRQQIPKTSIKIVRGIRLWFLPGIAELHVVLAIGPSETRFGMDIKRTDEGLMYISSVSKGLAADRAGLRKICGEASEGGQLVVISRLGGSSVVPSAVSSDGLINCCDHDWIKDRLVAAIKRMEDVHLHIMACPNQRSKAPIAHFSGPETLLPPVDYGF